jgi:hypothetical protein
MSELNLRPPNIETIKNRSLAALGMTSGAGEAGRKERETIGVIGALSGQRRRWQICFYGQWMSGARRACAEHERCADRRKGR